MADTAALNRPHRGLIAVGEAVVAGLLVWAAFAMWGAGVTTVTETLSSGDQLISTRYAGNWVAGAIGLGTVAALLVIDAARQVALAARA